MRQIKYDSFSPLIEIENYMIDKEWKQKGHNLRACQIYKSKETVIVYQEWLGAGYAILMALTVNRNEMRSFLLSLIMNP